MIQACETRSRGAGSSAANGATAIEEGPGQATKANRLRGSGGVLKILGTMGIWER